MTKTLSQLGEEYLEEAKKLEGIISDCREMLYEAYKKNNCNDILRFRRLLKLYYCQKNELLDNGHILINYYADNGRKGEQCRIF